MTRAPRTENHAAHEIAIGWAQTMPPELAVPPPIRSGPPPRRLQRAAAPLPGCSGDCAQGRLPCTRPLECGTAREQHDSWLDSETELYEHALQSRMARDFLVAMALVLLALGVVLMLAWAIES